MALEDIITNVEGKVSHSKLWCNIAYLAGTVKFIMIPAPTADIWAVYLGVVGGAAILSKYISMKFGTSPTDNGSTQ